MTGCSGPAHSHTNSDPLAIVYGKDLPLMDVNVPDQSLSLFHRRKPLSSLESRYVCLPATEVYTH